MDAIDTLVQAALNAMEDVSVKYTEQDLMAAAFTMCIRCTTAALKQNENLRPLALQATQILMMGLANPSRLA